MAIEVKLVLPPTLNSNFINNDFVLNNGDNYFSGKLSLAPSVTENKVTLSFGLELRDTDLREPVDLKTIKTLQISNDPNFTANSTVTINNWPYDLTAYDPITNNKVTGTNRNFIFTIDPASFHDPSNLPLGTTSIDNSGSDLFIIYNWPLSANGGLSTVYFKIEAQSITGSIGSYPSQAGIFDQIYWQPETGVKPGTPAVITRADGYTGKRTLIRFEAAQEGASNLYGTGVARYTGDIIEHRPLGTSDVGYQNQFSSNRQYSSTSTIYRNVFPNVNPHVSLGAATVRRWNIVPSTRVYTTASPSTLAANTTESATLTANTGLRFQLGTSNVSIATAKAPDFFAQTHVSVEMANELCDFDLTLGLSKAETNDSTAPSETSQVEVVINVDNLAYGSMPQSKVIYRTGSTETILQTTTISRSIIKDLKDGGSFELFLSKLKRPTELITPNAYDQKFVLRSYFTPDTDSKNLIY